MSAADLTKQAIIACTKELAAKKPFEKVSVIEITRLCDISRNTFYYYFKDKYAVIELIFETELIPVLSPFMDKDHWPESVIALCKKMRTEKDFYTSVLYDQDYRCLRQLLIDYYKNFLMQCAYGHFERLAIPEENREFVARFYSHAIIGLICDWVRAGMKKDPDLATRIIHLAAKERLFI